MSFDALFHSPLERARHTAELIWDGRSAPVTAMPSLREVDLYAFQVCGGQPARLSCIHQWSCMHSSAALTHTHCL